MGSPIVGALFTAMQKFTVRLFQYILSMQPIGWPPETTPEMSCESTEPEAKRTRSGQMELTKAW